MVSLGRGEVVTSEHRITSGGTIRRTSSRVPWVSVTVASSRGRGVLGSAEHQDCEVIT